MPNLVLADYYQKQINDVVTLAVADAVGLLNLIKDEPLRDAAGAMRDNLPVIGETYGAVVGQLSTDYYDAARAEAQVASSYVATVGDFPVEKTIQEGVGYAVAKIAQGSVFEEVATAIGGTIQRSLNGVNRTTISYNIVTDPDGTRYQRVPAANACAFCRTMAAVAEVQTDDYFSKYHDFCHCRSVPVFAGQKPYRADYYDEIENEYYKAVGELSKQRQEAGYYQYKRKEAAQKFPELRMVTENILPIVRQNTGWR